MKKILFLTIVCLFLAACQPVNLQSSTLTPSPQSSSSGGSSQEDPAPSQTPDFSSTPSFIRKPTRTPRPTPTPTVPQEDYSGQVPNFDHIALIVLENEGYDQVIGNQLMPLLNALANKNVLLSNYYARMHPSLPNYITLVSGDNQKITSDCTNCFVDAPNLADLIENSGRTWKSYEENLPSPCFVGDANPYAQKHDPFIYFDSIRNNAARCQKSIVPLTQLDADMSANQLPNFLFITPNLCNDGHNCSLDIADKWVSQMVSKLQSSSAFGKNSLIIITFDESGNDSTATCCGMGKKAGGQVVTILISPLAKQGFNDSTPYSPYDLLKTILVAWNLPDLGNTKIPQTQPIVGPWK